jgi:hypothetical protein
MFFSHADFGLQNCVRDAMGRLLIVDLEYCGMDSPVKQLFDCLLAPRCRFSGDIQSDICDYFLDLISSKDAANLPAYGAAFALKWMLIVLNEFIPEHWDRRVLANPTRLPKRQEILECQLRKAAIYIKIARSVFSGSSFVPEINRSERAELSKPY